jgi:Asp-tRNA(Asn)/Glu-tRNA(Gln) amidotransferase A subunit family amidase
VGDFQASVGLGSQTGGSIVRPGSFNGIYAFKPTWGAVFPEGQKHHSIILDTFGLFTRSVDDLELLADVFDIRDDEDSAFTTIQGARFAVCKTMVWASAGEGTRAAMARATDLLRAHGAIVDELELPEAFNSVPAWHAILMQADGRTSFLPGYRMAKDKLAKELVGFAENANGVTHRVHLEAFDGVGALRPYIDEIADRYAAILTPSAPDEAPEGIESTGSPVFCSIWTVSPLPFNRVLRKADRLVQALHTPVVNVPGFQGQNGMPIGVSLVAPRYRDRHLLKVSKAVGKIFEPRRIE